MKGNVGDKVTGCTGTDQDSALKETRGDPSQHDTGWGRPATGTWLKCWLTPRDSKLTELQREGYKTAGT